MSVYLYLEKAIYIYVYKAMFQYMTQRKIKYSKPLEQTKNRPASLLSVVL